MTAGLKSDNAPVFLVGATASGKSAAAMELARAWMRGGKGVAILAMDAMQVYREADIGTSKPTAAERAEVPHGGLDLVEFGGDFDVAKYLAHAAEFLREQSAAGRRVIIAGGTGLYFRALTQGLCEAPQGEDELREELNALSVEQLRERLQKVEPGMLESLDTSNPRRLIRAIEVKEATGRSLREWQKETPEPLVKSFEAFWIERTKEELHARIAARVEAMFAAGWVEEVKMLRQKYGIEAVSSFPGIGYREIGEWLAEGVGNGIAQTIAFPNGVWERGRQEGIDRVQRDILVATRQYAKRQLTWFRREPKLRKVMLSGTQPFPAVVLPLS